MSRQEDFDEFNKLLREFERMGLTFHPDSATPTVDNFDFYRWAMHPILDKNNKDAATASAVTAAIAKRTAGDANWAKDVTFGTYLGNFNEMAGTAFSVAFAGQWAPGELYGVDADEVTFERLESAPTIRYGSDGNYYHERDLGTPLTDEAVQAAVDSYEEIQGLATQTELLGRAQNVQPEILHDANGHAYQLVTDPGNLNAPPKMRYFGEVTPAREAREAYWDGTDDEYDESVFVPAQEAREQTIARHDLDDVTKYPGYVDPRAGGTAKAPDWQLVYKPNGDAGWVVPGSTNWTPAPHLNDPAMGSGYAAPVGADAAAVIASNEARDAASDTAAAAAAVLESERSFDELQAQQQFTYDQNAATRAQTQQQINAEIYNNNAARADNRVQQEFLRDKFAVETAMGRDAQVLQTEMALDSSLRDGRELSFQYQQLQQTAQQFNSTGQMQADVENQRRMEVQEARRAQLATDIGVTAQDAGSRGQLAARLLANPNLGSLDAGLAGGEDFFTGESLVPLTDLLGQRAAAAKDPNFLTFNPVTATPLPNIATPQFTTPGQYPVPELGAAYPDFLPTGGGGVVPPPQRPGGTETYEEGALRGAAMRGEHSRLMGLGFGPGSDEYNSALAAVAPSAEYTQRQGGMNVGAQLTQLPQSVLDDPRYPGNPGFEASQDAMGADPESTAASIANFQGIQSRAGGGLASGAYIGDEKGAELHIPLGLGEALVIPHDQVKNFLRKAAADGASLPGMEHGGMVKSQKQVNFLLSKGSPLTSKQRTKLKRELKSGSVKIGAMKKGGKFPEDSVAADLAGMGFGAMELGGVFDQGTIFGTARPTDQTGTRNFLNEALKRALTGTPWQAQGRAPTPVEVSAPGTDRIVQQLGASLSALGTGTPQDLFLRRAAALAPAGITERAGGVRRTA